MRCMMSKDQMNALLLFSTDFTPLLQQENANKSKLMRTSTYQVCNNVMIAFYVFSNTHNLHTKKKETKYK